MTRDRGLQPGDMLADRYRLVRILGTGGMGAIWEALNESTDRSFAIKVLHPTMARDPITVQRFIQEAKAAGRLRHRSIVEVYDMGTIGRLPYMVMELLDGEALLDRIQREKVLPLREGLEIGRACADALVVAHAAGIIHRDLKPANIFLHARGDAPIIPKILDFGISKLTDPDTDIGLTVTGVVIGTPSYMSPEQSLADETIDCRSDIWSLGMVMCRCLTGKSPLVARGYEQIAIELASDHQIDVPTVARNLPASVAAIIARCLEKDRAKRFATAADLSAAITRVLDEPNAMAMTAAVPVPTSSPSASLAGSALTFSSLKTTHVVVVAGTLALAALVIGSSAFMLVRAHGRSSDLTQEKAADSLTPIAPVVAVTPATSVELPPEPTAVEPDPTASQSASASPPVLSPTHHRGSDHTTHHAVSTTSAVPDPTRVPGF